MKNADAFVVKSATILIYSVLALLVLLSLMALAVPLLLNPNNYKTQMANTVLEKTGRTLTFAGNMSWELFPDPILTMEQITLSNAPGFSAEPMVKVQRLRGRLSVADLFKMRFVMKQLSLTGVEALLESDATGRNNWDDLIQHATQPHAQSQAEGGGVGSGLEDLPDSVADHAAGRAPTSLAQLGALVLSSLSVRSITLQESAVRACRSAEGGGLSCLHATRLAFTPQSDPAGHGTTVRVQADLTTQDPPFAGHVSLAYRQPTRSDRAITQWQDTEITVRGKVDMPPAKELELVWRAGVTMGPEPHRLHITRSDSTLTVWSDAALFHEFTLTMKGDAEADLSTGKLYLPQGGVTWRVKSDQLPPAGVELAFQSPIEMDWRRQALHIAPLQVTGPAQIRMEGQLHGDHLLSRPNVDVELTSFQFSPRDLLVATGRSVPSTTDPTAMQSGAGSAVIHLDEQSLAVTRMVLELDDARITGNLHWNADGRMANGPAVIRFDLQGDHLDLDRYLPPEWTDQNHAGRIAWGVVAPELWLAEMPAGWLDNLDLQGRVRLGELRSAFGRATDLSLAVELRDRQLHLQPYHALVHDGELDTVIQWDARGPEPLLTVDKTVTEMQLESLLRGLPSTRWLTGRANLVSHLSSRGGSPEQLWKNLTGTLTLMVHDGTLQGMDMTERFREGYAAILEPQRPLPPGPDKPQVEKRGVTPFTRLTATGRVAGGVLSNKDLLMLSPTLRVTGKGWQDLAQSTVDYSLEVDGSSALQGAAALSGQRMVLPIRIQGDLNTLKTPVVGPLRPGVQPQ
ncbi:MAG: AsmA family protein [Magnetococcus sp. MYC-9]